MMKKNYSFVTWKCRHECIEVKSHQLKGKIKFHVNFIVIDCYRLDTISLLLKTGKGKDISRKPRFLIEAETVSHLRVNMIELEELVVI